MRKALIGLFDGGHDAQTQIKCWRTFGNEARTSDNGAIT
jgi:hypothetical protein